MRLSNGVAFVLILVVIYSCSREQEKEPTLFSTELMEIDIPSNLPTMMVPASNPVTKAGFDLGRRLYYDSILDPFHARACASCHIQQFGFTTPGSNVIPHVNLAYNTRFLWNGEVEGTLEDAMRFEVEDFFHTDASKIQKSGDYPYLFLKAFGSTEVTTERCALAIAQFLRANISGNSKFDRYVRHEENLTQDEMSGLLLFFTEKGDCFHCHSMSLMTDGGLHNIGLDSIFSGINSGYYNHSGDEADLGKFKSPSLRNCAIRTSFMHDGRFSTLEEVIEHYNSGVKQSPSLDAVMTKPGKELGLQLTLLQKQQLKAFLTTLTDSTYLTNPLFSSPFQ